MTLGCVRKMPKIIDPQELNTIMRVLAEHDLLSISQLITELATRTSRRTLQRRLEQLLQQKKIVVVGTGSNRLYQCATTKKENQEKPIKNTRHNNTILKKIKQPVAHKKTVPYNADFLLSYKPNKTFYLPEKTRTYLRQIGQQFHQKLEPGTYAKRMLHRLLIDLSWNSSRLEGNTYSLLETEKLLAFGAEASGKDAFETQMILNHKNAIEFMVENVADYGLGKYFIFNIHALLSDGLLSNPGAQGYLRKIPVGIGKTGYTPLAIPQLIDDYFQLILEKTQKIKDPFEQSFFLMVHLPYLQPFEDVNKRVSRLSANIPLMQHNFAPLSFVNVPKDDYIHATLAVYELNDVSLLHDVFVWAYEQSAKQYKLVFDTLTEPNPIVMKYQKTLHALVTHVVETNLHGNEIIACVERQAKKYIKPKDQSEFIRYAELKIASLHEGNIAVYRISPSVFAKWKQA